MAQGTEDFYPEFKSRFLVHFFWRAPSEDACCLATVGARNRVVLLLIVIAAGYHCAAALKSCC